MLHVQLRPSDTDADSSAACVDNLLNLSVSGQKYGASPVVKSVSFSSERSVGSQARCGEAPKEK